MKYLIILIVLLTSCTNGTYIKYGEQLFVVKAIDDWNGVCRYSSYSGYIADEHMFMDECGKFQIGDTVTTCKYNQQ